MIKEYIKITNLLFILKFQTSELQILVTLCLIIYQIMLLQNINKF